MVDQGRNDVLFTQLKFGRCTLPNRIVMSPMTRSRADEKFAPPTMAVTYYTQRASAGLIIAESTTPSPEWPLLRSSARHLHKDLDRGLAKGNRLGSQSRRSNFPTTQPWR